MPSTFFGLHIAGSGLFAFQAANNTIANNISNVQTVGYSRQVANIQAAQGLRVSATYGTMGAGVVTTSITQLRDSYYDTKYWQNQAKTGMFDRRLYYMDQIESIYRDDDVTTGFATIFSKMFNSLDSLKNNAGDANYRNQFISDAMNLSNYFNSIATQMQSLQKDINDEIKSTVDMVNATAQKIALLNKQINSIEINGGYANELRDQRALLVDELSTIVPVEVEEYKVANSNYADMYTGATNYKIKVNGQLLVDTFDYHELKYTARENKINQTDAEGLFDVTWAETGMSFNPTALSMSGRLKGLFEMRDGNNKSNFNGKIGMEDGDFGTATVDGKTVTTVTVVDPSITDVKNLNIAQEGTLTVRGNNYDYSNFEMKREPATDGSGNPILDEDGNQTYTYSYTFTLERELSTIEKGNMAGRDANIGLSIDAMGVPYYMAQMSEFIRVFSKTFNDLQRGTADNPGLDLEGNEMGTFFVAKNITDGTEYDFTEDAVSSYSNSYYQLTALDFAVSSESVRNPARISTQSKENFTAGVDRYDIAEAIIALENDTTLYRGSAASDFLRCILSDITVDTNEAKLFKENYENIGYTIDTQRQSISGVDEDEEGLEMIKFYNAYNLASKMISVMAQMYDKLINETGV